jgi:hypothetical protein
MDRRALQHKARTSDHRTIGGSPHARLFPAEQKWLISGYPAENTAANQRARSARPS